MKSEVLEVVANACLFFALLLFAGSDLLAAVGVFGVYL
jgi:hypothetical protein